jgi:hypothetical protein
MGMLRYCGGTHTNWLTRDFLLQSFSELTLTLTLFELLASPSEKVMVAPFPYLSCQTCCRSVRAGCPDSPDSQPDSSLLAATKFRTCMFPQVSVVPLVCVFGQTLPPSHSNDTDMHTLSLSLRIASIARNSMRSISPTWSSQTLQP